MRERIVRRKKIKKYNKYELKYPSCRGRGAKTRDRNKIYREKKTMFV